MNIDYVLKEHPDPEMQTMYSEVAKRETFVDNFSLPNHTSELITGIEARTSTFAELLA